MKKYKEKRKGAAKSSMLDDFAVPSSFYYLFRDRFVSPVDFLIHYTLS